MSQAPSNRNPPPAASELRSGSTFAERYRIEGTLGTGPDSTVYRAQDALTNEAVAVKLIRRTLASESSAISQYRLELNLWRQAHHRALVRVVDSGEDLGRLHLVMELIEGSTLRDHLRTNRQIPIDQFSEFFAEMCSALGQVHAQRIIHRDIHPANIMITQSGAWKLMDFGIGRNARKRGSAEHGYAAPEQLMSQPPSFATDIYSLGVVFYEMLTGRQPHPGGRPGRNAPVFLEEEIADCPPGLASLIETCMHVDSTKRFQNVQALKAGADQIFGSGVSRVSGPRLQDFLMESPADPQKMTILFARIIRALIQLHEAGRSHAELSPLNIWVNGDSVGIECSPRKSASPSQSTILISDARYTAPELIMARSTPDQAAHIAGDIYVLGFMFYELLAGKKEMGRQFAELEPMQTGLAWMRWHADPKLTLRPLGEVSSNCPRSVLELIERMVEKAPSKRLQTLEEAAETLDRINVRLATTQSFTVAQPESSRNRKPPGAAAGRTIITVVALLALVAGARWLGTGGWHTLARRILRLWSGAVISGRPTATAAIVHTATGLMVRVAEGEFVMGDDSVPNEAPAHKVTLPAYYIDRLEVSNRMYREFCARTGHRAPAPAYWETVSNEKDDLPVVNISHDDAVAFCRYAGKHLPSEEEWEKAARGPGKPVVLWGNWTLPGLANLKGSGNDRPSAVGSFAADISPFGVLDMAGNVQEWVAGEYKSYSTIPGTANYPEPAQYIVRGGGFRTPAGHLSPSWREALPLTAGSPELEAVGFRCAADASVAFVDGNR
jgi:serine/threonine protein kinase